jgi:hypothetical protein
MVSVKRDISPANQRPPPVCAKSKARSSQFDAVRGIQCARRQPQWVPVPRTFVVPSGLVENPRKMTNPLPSRYPAFFYLLFTSPR